MRYAARREPGSIPRSANQISNPKNCTKVEINNAKNLLDLMRPYWVEAFGCYIPREGERVAIQALRALDTERLEVMLRALEADEPKEKYAHEPTPEEEMFGFYAYTMEYGMWMDAVRFVRGRIDERHPHPKKELPAGYVHVGDDVWREEDYLAMIY